MKITDSPGFGLVQSQLGARAAAAVATLNLDALLIGAGGVGVGVGVSRAMLAAALNIVLFADLLDRVPTGAAYVAERRAGGERIQFDHGALRTIRFPDGPTGALPAGEAAFTRILQPLGYRLAGVYPLPRLCMTGRAYAHADAPEQMPQFFLSELHVEQFDDSFADAAQAVFSTSRDPLGTATHRALQRLAAGEILDPATAQDALADLVAAFARQHPVPHLAHYETLVGQSAEAGWIATEGNAFNHATDRVASVEAVAAAERAMGRPIKAKVEISASGRVRQTAHRAAMVSRPFIDASGNTVFRDVPGSFYEFISRDLDPATGRIDLRFDSGNATGIFAMTRTA